MGKDQVISVERNVGRVYVSTGQLVVSLRVWAGGIIDRDVDAIQLSIRRFETWIGWEARFIYIYLSCELHHKNATQYVYRRHC